jgi:hypothetical protein
MSQNPDSNFYPLLNVSVVVLSSGNHVIDTYHLNKVDLNTEGYQKQGGTFFTSPNYAYKFTNALNPNYTYRILIQNPQSGEVDSSESPVVDTSGFVFDQFAIPGYKISLYSTNPTQILNISGTLSPQAVVYQLVMRIHWIDSTATSSVPQSADWMVTPITHASASNTFDIGALKIPVLNFFYFLRDNMGTPAAGVSRYLKNVDMMFYSGSQAISDYQQLSLYAGTGITGMDNEPVYTNIKGKNAYGIFASRNTRSYYNINFDDATKDSLRFSQSIQNILVNLNVKGVAN